MDLETGADRVLAAVAALGAEHWQNAAIFVAVLGLVLYSLRANGFLARLWRVTQDTILTNWQLALLGAAAIVLSLASGWRTWDGMRNFTGEPALSLMITFGIQAVMLIVAWLIGESFATGMSQQVDGGRRVRKPVDGAIGMVLGLAISGATFYWLLHVFGAVSWTRTADFALDWNRFATIAMYFVIALLVVGALAFSFSRGGELAVPYVRGTRVIARNVVLWVMFLACMGTSVFFSFDSFFSAIFPADQRTRAAELRAQNQVSGILADTGATISSRRVTEAARLFETAEWKAYDTQLTELTGLAQSSSGALKAYFIQELEQRRRLVTEQQERRATAQSGQAGLLTRKTALTEELARARSERPGLAAEYAQHKSELDAKAREVDAKRVEAMAEARGVEGTGKEGRGPAYRQRMGELDRLQGEYDIKEERTRDAEKRVRDVEGRIAQLERELANIDGDLAKLASEMEAADQRIRVAQDTATGDGEAKLDPDHMLPIFEQARAEFRREPTVERLGNIQQLCSQITSALASAPTTGSSARNIECNPKQVHEAAAVVFGLNSGLRTFEAQCAGGSRLEQLQSADDLFGFARRCLADSGLPSADTEALRASINRAELNRDDKAHRFVVTLNAFEDGNTLAHLALAIAIGLDSLIFMAGLFGANAVRSPLSDVPTFKARSAQQLEAIIDTALLPHRLETARLALGAMQPITPEDGFIAEVLVHEDDPHAADLRRVLNAGATIGAVRQPYTGVPRYEVRAELFEYLSLVAKREFEADKQHAALADMERVISVALLPDIGANADIVLSHLHPIREENGFMAEVRMDELPDGHAPIVRSVLNAATTYNRVKPAGDAKMRYLVHGDFYRILARIRGRLLNSATLSASRPAIGSLDGGVLDSIPIELQAHSNGHRQLTDQTRSTPKQPIIDEAFRSEVLIEVLDGIGVPLSAYERLMDGQVAEAAVAAGNALLRMADQYTDMRELLLLRDRGWKSGVERVQEELLERYKDSPAAMEIVERTVTAMSELIPALLLSPEVGLVEELIDALEGAAASDDLQKPGEKMLLEQLRELQSADLASEAPWKRARVVIEHLEADSPPTRLN